MTAWESKTTHQRVVSFQKPSQEVSLPRALLRNATQSRDLKMSLMQNIFLPYCQCTVVGCDLSQRKSKVEDKCIYWWFMQQEENTMFFNF